MRSGDPNGTSYTICMEIQFVVFDNQAKFIQILCFLGRFHGAIRLVELGVDKSFHNVRQPCVPLNLD